MEFNFEYLVGRPKRSIVLNNAEITYFKDSVIAVTGGAGSIGGAIALQLLKETSSHVILIDSDESRLHTYFVNLPSHYRERTNTRLADIRDYISIETALINIKPDLVIHAAALKHVSVLESAPREAFLTNVLGTQNILSAINDLKIKSFVFVSTDKAANPINILGKTKLIGEYLTAGSSKRHPHINFSVVRFGNVFLSRGSVLETFMAQIQLKEELTITDPSMERFFIDPDEASTLILKTIAASRQGISILKMGDPVSILELVKKLLKQLDTAVGFKIIGAKPGEKFSEDLFNEREIPKVENFEEFSFSAFTKAIPLEAILQQDYSSDLKSELAINNLLKESYAI